MKWHLIIASESINMQPHIQLVNYSHTCYKILFLFFRFFIIKIKLFTCEKHKYSKQHPESAKNHKNFNTNSNSPRVLRPFTMLCYDSIFVSLDCCIYLCLSYVNNFSQIIVKHKIKRSKREFCFFFFV